MSEIMTNFSGKSNFLINFFVGSEFVPLI